MTTKVRIVTTEPQGIPPEHFKDIHKGGRCFLIGNGPSAREWTMKEMRSLNAHVIGINGSWIPSKDGTYQGFQDTDYHAFVSTTHCYPVCKNKVRTGVVFMPKASRWVIVQEDCTWKPAKYCYIGVMSGGYQPQRFRFDIDKGISTKFAGYFALQIAAWMSFYEILLVGFSARDHEAHSYDDEPYKGRVTREGMRRWFVGPAEWANTKGKRIINCDPRSAIHSFPKMSKQEIFDEL